ncbi:DUF2513 domain-containing protein [Citreicella sp. C3M06]|uniref:DUF2513 domain-containing protein n=1 Tax=Citreicella sp. C3M06 TaxID=2841564 RepID=UPI001C0A483B|nr:DUF2513 domain-containing protein [Citreicella sp. C3M06]MBU2961989.1 DUF2513 domain-containing protein [Citreicella sp. C3M06]
MKRDLDLLREMLIRVEDFTPSNVGEVQKLNFEEFSEGAPAAYHHALLLVEARLLRQYGRYQNGSGCIYVDGMTMQGHDFLDAIRDHKIWDATKQRVWAVGGWTLEIVLDVARSEIKRLLTDML